MGRMLETISLESTPPESANLIYQKVREITGNNDPYKELKDESTQKALTLYPSLKKQIERSNDKLLAAIRIAIAGNVMDFGANTVFDIDKEIDEALKKDFGICHYSAFTRHLNEASDVLYIGDNAGECVFDRLLIEQLKKPTIYVVRDIPVINDATYEDAVQAGIDKVATIISSGTNAPGTILKTCNAEFIETYRNSKFIISKGQGNYEALSNEKRPIFFLLKAKCRVIAKDIGVNDGDIVLLSSMPQAAECFSH